MFKLQEIADLNQISLTGARAIVVLGLLMIKPRSLEEIKQGLIDYKIMDKTQSYDILRIDLNTLKYIGCNISRASQSTNYKYVLKEHPYSLKIDKSDIKILKKVYDEIKTSADLHLLLNYDALFKKIAQHISEEEIQEEMKGISIFKRYNIELVKFLIKDCAQERVLTILYKNPSNGLEQKKEVAALKILLKNDKLYLYCYDMQKGKHVTLNVRRILAIIGRKFKKNNSIDVKLTKIKFHLKDFGYDIVSDEENILEANDNGYIIEGNYYSEFLAIQRVLSFGSKCTIIEPEDFKQKIIKKLEEMRKIYE